MDAARLPNGKTRPEFQILSRALCGSSYYELGAAAAASLVNFSATLEGGVLILAVLQSGPVAPKGLLIPG
jgi:hypothetical protein